MSAEITAYQPDTNHLTDAIGAMIALGAVRFQAFMWCMSAVSFVVYTEVFTDREITRTVTEDDWNDGPEQAVAKLLAGAGERGELTFVRTNPYGLIYEPHPCG